MNPLSQRQVQSNKSTSDRWDFFTEHRGKITEILVAAARSNQARLCVLGAGNCNDLDLGILRSAYSEIHLVDLDADAIAHGTTRQGLENCPAIIRHGGIDLTGMLEGISTWTPLTAIGATELSGLIEEPLRRVPAVLPGPFDVVVSTCMLSQLTGAMVHSVSDQHPRFMDVFQAVRLGHARLFGDLIAPGGTGVLAFDILSSLTFPRLAYVAENELLEVLTRLVKAGNFFHGANPDVIESLFRYDLVLRSLVSDIQRIHPWRWNNGSRIYAVCALKVRR